MLTIRKAEQRGHANHGWLDSHHTFSFADYRDPQHMGFRGLRVINEDRVEPGRGFGTHSHRDMEIISYVVDGGLEHRDSMGNGSTIAPGDIQRMSAGTGVSHSEFNASKQAPVHFLQIWIIPSRAGFAPSYEQKMFDVAERSGRLRLVVDPQGRDGAVGINADARVYAAVLAVGEQVEHVVAPGRHAWVQVVRGSVEIAGAALHPGDGASTSDPGSLVITPTERAELLVFDLG